MGFLKRLFGSSNDGGTVGDGVDAPAEVSSYEKTGSGLEYYDLKVGEGASPIKGQRATVHYTGWLTNGKRFDSSVVKKKPFTFEVGRRRVIKAWDEGVMTMRVGGIRQLKAPADLAYGRFGHPPRIPENATLIFEVELLSIS